VGAKLVVVAAEGEANNLRIMKNTRALQSGKKRRDEKLRSEKLRDGKLLRGAEMRLGLQTRAVHAGEPNRHGVGGPVATEVYHSSTFTFSSVMEMKKWAEGKSKAYIYTRYGNPTLAVAEKKIAALEGAEAAVVTASGMAAISSVLLGALKTGDEVISTADLYGGSYRLMRDVFPDMGIKVHLVGTDLAGMEGLVTARTKVIYVETPTNPTLRLVDLRRVMAFAKKHKLVSIIDNTFATPLQQQPIAMGFDMVVHSATKYMGGHSDIIAGAAAGSAAWMKRVQQMVIYLGGSMDPGAAYLLIRGMKTIGLRMERQSANTLAVARYLEKHPKVARVYYPGLRSHPDHLLAKRQMSGFGAMMAFDLKGGLAAARRFCERVRIFLLAASLGGVESLVILPIYSSHYDMSKKELARVGVSPGTVRMSVGIEDVEDLIGDLAWALG
jgi:cystathionine beta-lyase/cystathionine gamma-synthase